jgi:hypothetical protein
MKTRFTLLVIALFIAGISCEEEKSQLSRSFYMGFTPFPYEASLVAVEETYANIRQNSDIIAHHFDNGIPWAEAKSDAPFSNNILDDWSYRKSSTPPGHKLYVAVAALNPDRNGLALYRGSSDNLPLPSPWDSYSFNSSEVKVSYLNYCKRIIDYFSPDYFNMSVEANLLHFLAPEKWQDYFSFHQYIYQELKSLYPDLPVFCSITGAHLLEGYYNNNDISKQRQAALNVLEFSDMYAISFYPYLSNYLGDPYPANSFGELFSLSSKPLAIAETGYPAQSFTIDSNGTPVVVESNAKKQESFVLDLLNSCTEGKAEFVIQFTIRDYDQLWEDLGSKDDLTIAWRDTGLIDESANARPSLKVWTDFLKRPVQ